MKRDEPALSNVRQIFANLEVISEGATHNPDAQGGGKPESRPPRGDEAVLDEHRDRVMASRTLKEFKAALEAARQARDAYRSTARPSEPERWSYFWKLEIVAELDEGKRTISSAASHYGVSRPTLYEWQKKYGKSG